MRREIAIVGIAIAGVTFPTPEQAWAACPTTVLSFKDSGGTVQTLCFGGGAGAFIPQYQILDSAGTNALSVTAGGAARVDPSAVTSPVTVGNITVTAQTLTVTVGNITVTGQTLTVTQGAITVTAQTLTITSTAIAISGVPTVQPVPAISGGLSVCASAATATAITCKNTAGQIYGWAIGNTNTTQEYIQIFDSSSATSVTLGTTVAKFQFPLPAGATANVFGDIGATFVSGIVFAATTLRTGSSSPTTALDINLFYK